MKSSTKQFYKAQKGMIMKMKFKKIIACFCLAAVGMTAVGCSSNGGSDSANGGTTKITWWTTLFPHISQTAASNNDVPFYQELEKRCNVDLEFIHPASGQESEKFNVMCASGEYPDLIEWDFMTYKGGPAKAVEDGVIVYIDDYLDDAPNYKKYLEEHPDVAKQVVTDEGKHYTFAFIRGDESLMCWKGPQIRKDLLDKAGLALPETIEEWDTALRKFKEMGIAYPLSSKGANFSDAFSGAFGVSESFYQEDGKVKYGPMEPGYKDYITQMNQWFKDGILDNDFFAQDSKALNAKITTGMVGAFVASAGGDMGSLLPTLQTTDASYDLSGTKYPVMKKGDTPRFGQMDFAYYPMVSVAISSQCKNIKEVVKFLDYGYSEEGHMFWNFGTEGVSYNMENGYPQYTDEILKNPEGLSIQAAMSKYAAAAYGGPFVQDARYYEQYLPYQQQNDAVKLWADHDGSTRIPYVSYTAEEGDQRSKKMAVISSYVNENVLKFITGQIDMNEWEEFVSQIKANGIDEVLEIMQNALDRYNKR